MYTATFLLLATATLVFAGPLYKQKPDYKKYFSLGSDATGSRPILPRRLSGGDVDLGRGVAVDFSGDDFKSAGSHVDVLGSGAPYYEGSDIIRKYKPVIGAGGRVSGGGSTGGGRIVTDIGTPYTRTSYSLPVDLGDDFVKGPYTAKSRYEPIAVGSGVGDISYPAASKFDYGYRDGLPISSRDDAIVYDGVSSSSPGISPYRTPRYIPEIVGVGAADPVLSSVGGAADVIGSSRRKNYLKSNYAHTKAYGHPKKLYDREEPHVISPYPLGSSPAVVDVGADDSVFSGVGGAADVIGSARGKNYLKSNYAHTKAYGYPRKPYGSLNKKGLGLPRRLRSSRLSLGVPSAVSRRSLIDFGDSGNFAGGTRFAASGSGAVVDYEGIGKGSGSYYSKGRRHISQYINGLDYGLSRDDIRFIIKSKAFPSNMHIPKRRLIKW